MHENKTRIKYGIYPRPTNPFYSHVPPCHIMYSHEFSDSLKSCCAVILHCSMHPLEYSILWNSESKTKEVRKISDQKCAILIHAFVLVLHCWCNQICGSHRCKIVEMISEKSGILLANICDWRAPPEQSNPWYWLINWQGLVVIWSQCCFITTFVLNRLLVPQIYRQKHVFCDMLVLLPKSLWLMLYLNTSGVLFSGTLSLSYCLEISNQIECDLITCRPGKISNLLIVGKVEDSGCQVWKPHFSVEVVIRQQRFKENT